MKKNTEAYVESVNIFKKKRDDRSFGNSFVLKYSTWFDFRS